MNSIPICIYSHSSVEDVLEIQLNYISKILNINKQKIYLFIDKPYNKNTNLKYETVLYDDNIPYNKRLVTCISKINEPYFILSHENDILISFDINTIIEIQKNMKINNIDSVVLRHYLNCENLIKINDNISLSDTDPEFIFNVQPRIWKKSSAIKLFSSIPDKTYKNIENVNVQSYVKINQKTYSVCSTTPLKSTAYTFTTPEYIYAHITSDGKFRINDKELDPLIKVAYDDMYNKYIKDSFRNKM